MSGPKRAADKLNTIGIVVVGICSAVLVYVTIVALQAFYVDDSSEIQMMADYGGQDTQARTIKAEQLGAISKSMPNPAPKSTVEVQTYRIPIKVAMEKIVVEAKVDHNNGAANLVPAYGPAKCRTTEPEFGRPKPDAKPPCPMWGAPEPEPAPAPAPTPDPQLTPTGGTGPGGGPLPGQKPGTTTNNPKGDGR